MTTVTIINCAAFNGGSSEELTKHYANTVAKFGVKCYNTNLTRFLKEIDITNIGTRTAEFSALVYETIEKADKIVFIVPEYNSSYPGVLKLFLDVVEHTKWIDKKVAIVGTSGGRGGNLRGMDHLTSILNYLQMNVHYIKLPLSDLKQRFGDDGTVTVETHNMIAAQIQKFLSF